MPLPDFILYFGLALAFSFFGSIPPATGNLITIQVSIEKGMKAALLFAFGEVIIEGIYGYIALKISDYITTSSGIEFYLKLSVIPIFIALAVYYFLNKQKVNDSTTTSKKTSFAHGILIGILNPLAIPYWVFYFSLFYSNKWIVKNSNYEWLLIVGIPVGSFLLLSIYAFLGKYISKIIHSKIEWMNKTIAFVFLLLACIQAIQLLTELS